LELAVEVFVGFGAFVAGRGGRKLGNCFTFIEFEEGREIEK
jgi:hypothetical protein